ncbi:hypothetical protein [Marinimicrobium sp. ABcell2]|uniref:hypothetical protein n=1 Tax=Marinimicrobium sp. ABcell2 TaxID=3069751 RepID=UPI0027B09A2F|nr:hypothetical protein [Marinimicrobium sp. ABcell2]MDQ2077423.1 hypothetical protein [Marinimicrobium sp. ABcell2]
MTIVDSAILTALNLASAYQIDGGPLLGEFDLDEDERTVTFTWLENDGEFSETVSLSALEQSIVDATTGSITTTNVDGEPVTIVLHSFSVPAALANLAEVKPQPSAAPRPILCECRCADTFAELTPTHVVLVLTEELQARIHQLREARQNLECGSIVEFVDEADWLDLEELELTEKDVHPQYLVDSLPTWQGNDRLATAPTSMYVTHTGIIFVSRRKHDEDNARVSTAKIPFSALASDRCYFPLQR